MTFLCTVRNPQEIVKAGLRDVTTSLTHYLIRHQPLFHQGEDHHLDQVTIVRHNVTSEVKAYFSVRPARLRGLDVKLGNVQVMTPDELRLKQREREVEGLLTLEEQRMEHRLAQQGAKLEEERRRNEEAFELERRRHEQDLARMQQKLTQMEEGFQHQLEQQKLAHEQFIRTTSFEHAVGEAHLLKDALAADDSEMTTFLAGAIGERSVSETTNTLNADREHRRGTDAAQAAQEREWVHEEARYRRQLDRESAQMNYDLEIARLKTQAEVVVAAVNRGLADHQNVEFLIGELKSVAKQLESASANGRQESERAESPTYSEPPKRSAQPERPDVQGDDRVIEAELVSDDFEARGVDTEPEPREEDLGR